MVSNDKNQKQWNRTEVKDRVSNDIGAKEPLKEWADINWKLAHQAGQKPETTDSHAQLRTISGIRSGA